MDIVTVSFAGAGSVVLFTWYVKSNLVGLAVGCAREVSAPMRISADKTTVFKP